MTEGHRPAQSRRAAKPRSGPAEQVTGHHSTFVPGTDAIESLHSRYRRAITVRGHFPTKQAALKTLYLATRGLDPKGTGQARWVTRWKPALHAFAVTFADRMPAAESL
jgi:transposase-like protein